MNTLKSMKTLRSKKIAPKKPLRSMKSVKNVKRIKEHEPLITELIRADHKPILALIQQIHKTNRSVNEKREDYHQLETLFKCHTFAEERSLYAYIKNNDQMREEGFKGDFEHTLMAQLIREIVDIDDDSRWIAKVRTLCDLMENHMKKEETLVLKKLARIFPQHELVTMGQKYSRYLDEIVDDEKVPATTTIYDPHGTAYLAKN